MSPFCIQSITELSQRGMESCLGINMFKELHTAEQPSSEQVGMRGGGLYSLLKERMVMAHIHFILAFINSWWGPNFSWHKRIDRRTNVNGFLARHLPVHFYIQHRDLETLRDNWAVMIFLSRNLLPLGCLDSRHKKNVHLTSFRKPTELPSAPRILCRRT